MSSEKHTSNPRNAQGRTIKGSELKQRLFLETQIHRLRVVVRRPMFLSCHVRVSE